MQKISRLCARAHIKPALILPLLALICLGAVAVFWYAGPEAKAAGAGAGQVQVAPEESWRMPNPLLRELVRVPELAYDANETAELEQLFSDAISAAAAAKVTRGDYHRAVEEIKDALVDALEDHLATYPNSAWVPSLRCNLAAYYRRIGQQTLALTHWQNTWTQLNESNHPITKDIADTAFGRWTSLLASLGRVEDLTLLLRATRERNFGLGENRLLLNQTIEGYNQMVADPASAYRCGSLALANLSRTIGVSEQASVKFLSAGSPETGFSVAQLLQLAQSQNVRLTAVFQENPGEIIVPSIVHWSQEHYAAILKQNGDKFLIVDPTFGRPTWVSKYTIDAEASGVFIIPSELFRAGEFRMVTDAESASIFGRGNPNQLTDSNDNSCDPEESCECEKGSGGGGSSGGGNGGSGHGSNGKGAGLISEVQQGAAELQQKQQSQSQNCVNNECGMAQWRVSEPYLNLWIHDQPWAYQPSKGEGISVKVAHKQRNVYLGPVLEPFSFVQWLTLGATWNFNYSSLLVSMWTPGTTYFTVDLALPGGGIANFVFENGATQATNFYKNAVLAWSYDALTDSITNYTLLQ